MEHEPGNLFGSFTLSIIAKRGKWFRQESIVSKTALSDMMAMRAIAKFK